MNTLDLWRLSDELDLWKAAVLIIGESPSEYHRNDTCKLDGSDAVINALKSALRNEAITGTICPEIGYRPDLDLECDVPDSISLESRVNVESLTNWLRSRGVTTGFFFDTSISVDYLDPKNDRYAPKLAAAVNAWQAVVSPGKSSPKQALMKWLREHAADYKLSDEDGKPNETAIEEIAKVANWKPSGGAAKTPD